MKNFIESRAVVDTLLCFPFAGGSASYFTKWKSSCPVNMKPLELPGRGKRYNEMSPKTIKEVAARLFEEESYTLQGNIALFGHSMGAILAYEFACNFYENHSAQTEWDIHSLIVSGCGSPKIHQGIPDIISSRNENALLHLVHSLNGTPLELIDNPEFKSFFLPMIQKDLAMLNTYPNYGHKSLNLPILSLRGNHDIFQTPTDMQDWSNFTTNTYEFYEFEGDHFFINDHEPVLEKIKIFWSNL